MYARFLTPPNHSFFLFGSRSTGKTTWLESRFSDQDALFFDLLDHQNFLNFSRDPDLLIKNLKARGKREWIVVDEVQRVPSLLNTVHRIMNEHGSRVKFVLSGSSARKIKQQNANLLAGRALYREFFPLVGHELNYEFDLDQILAFGTLPAVVSSPEFAVDILESYVVTYLQQEIQQEAVTRNLDAFHRFLQVAGLMNGRVLNISNIARDCGIARTTVERYFTILVDTLIACWLPAWNPRFKVKQLKSPKFYFFDSGVVRGITGSLRDPIERFEKGFYLETLVLNELRAWLSYSNSGGELSYWGIDANDDDKEIDFIWTRGKQNIAIEVKSSDKWRTHYGRYMGELLNSKKITAAYGVYLGERDLVENEIHVFTLKSFMQKLFSGELIK